MFNVESNETLLTAIQVYSHIGDIGMVISLKSLRYLEDKKLISAHICKFLGQLDRAQVINFYINFAYCFTYFSYSLSTLLYFVGIIFRI